MSLRETLRTHPRLQRARDLAYAASTVRRLWGSEERQCPLCGNEGKFVARGTPPRLDAQCPRCGSLERHRLLALVVRRARLVRPTDRVLHFAPEDAVRSILLDAGVTDYVSADIAPDKAELVLDVEDMDLPDASYDVVVASHVLEHVDDRKSLAEIRRVLRPGGRLIAMFPVIEGWDETHEDDAVTAPDERFQEFGQADHVRYYGRDVRERFVEAGLRLEEHVGSPGQVRRHALMRGERVFVAHRD